MNLYESINNNLKESDDYKLRITLTNDSDIALAPSNIVVTKEDGRSGASKYLENLVSNCNSAEELANKLNDNRFPNSGDKRIFGEWKPVRTETNVSKNICTNMFMNKHETIKYDKVITVDNYDNGNHQILKIYKDGTPINKINEDENTLMSLEDFKTKLEELGVTNVSPLYYVTGAPDCHSIEQADDYYDSLPNYSSVNYKKDKYDLTDEAFKFIDEHRDLAHEILYDFAREMDSSGPLD